MNRRMIRAYFQQTMQYFSESANNGEGAFANVADMHPRHARNAAVKLQRECDFWAKEAGIETDSWVWLVNTPLFKALTARAMDA